MRMNQLKGLSDLDKKPKLFPVLAAEVGPCALLLDGSCVDVFTEGFLHVVSTEHCVLPRGSLFQDGKTNREG